MTTYSATLPAAVFGKRFGRDRMPQGYEWLARSPSIPSEPFQDIEGFMRAFQWVSGCADRTYDAVACWIPEDPEGKAGFLVRFLDAGEDEQGRPHTVRAEAGYVDATVLSAQPDLPFALLLAAGSMVSQYEGTENAELSLSEQELETEPLRGALPDTGGAPLRCPVILTPEPIRFRVNALKDAIVISKESYNRIPLEEGGREEAAITIPNDNTSKEARLRMPPPRPRRSKGGAAITFILLLTTIGLAGLAWHQDQNLDAQRSTLDEQKSHIAALQDSLAGKDAEYVAAAEDNEELQAKAGELETKLANLERENERLRQDIRRLENEKLAMEEDLDGATKQRLDWFERLRDAVADAIDHLKTLVDSLGAQNLSLGEAHPYETLIDTYEEMESNIQEMNNEHHRPEVYPRSY